MRKVILVFVIVVGLASIWFVSTESRAHHLTVRTYFRTTDSLKPGSMVKVDGIELGSVKAVNLRPELGKRPVEVVMEFGADNGLQIPNDSIASPEAEGVLGAIFVEIDTRQAAGLPLRGSFSL